MGRVTDGPRVEHMRALHRLAAPLKMSVLVCVYWDTRVCVSVHVSVLWRRANVYLGVLLGAEGSQRERFSTCYPSRLLSSHQPLSSVSVLT